MTFLDIIASVVCCSMLCFSLIYGVYLDHKCHRRDIIELKELLMEIKNA